MALSAFTAAPAVAADDWLFWNPGLGSSRSSQAPSSSGGGFFDGLFGGSGGGSNGHTSGGNASGRHVVSFSPRHAPGQIIVSFADRRLYYVHRRGQAISYPIAAPRPQSRWQGTMRISRKQVNPTWTPTPEMRRENPRLPSYVPGGHPRNPLGYRALYLGSSLYRIHGTDAPWTIGQPVSKGCIRMYNSDVADLYNRVPVGTKVVVTWNRYGYSG
ncbi:MAG: L,D-transpeptidase [Hyphomicrobiaceae bacterium]|nr:L,D-transpeptidase [Hyphomicrobiaceae bacterium]